ncbi:MAG: 3-oxoacyl-[acyl-carrier-protein] reductase [Chloroflexi bacterium]|nr:3-oxoacyl-[acyl-carrier-protein] reductase [Chloroflexota bacterium]
MSDEGVGPLPSEGRVALVTGSSRGIGRAIALRLAKAGTKVVVNYVRREEEARAVANAIEALGSKAIVVKADVTNTQEVQAMFQKVQDTWGAVDILVNNAGIIKDSLLVRMSDRDWDETIAVNLRSTFLCTRAALRLMVRRRWGRIINIASVVAMVGNVGQANYAASKAGVIALTRSVAKEVASRNITANVVAPGYITTDIVEELPAGLKERILARIPVGRFGTVEDVAALAAFVASEEASYITGQVLSVDGGMAIGW